MKKTLIALAVLGSIAGVAQAQSSVTIYGKLDQGLRKVTDQKLQLTNRAFNRIGFKGAEDLGGGLSAIFQFENRFLADTGDQFGTRLFHAQSNVGLKGNFGTVRLGRIYNPVDFISYLADPFGNDGVASMQLNALNVVRQDNSIVYDSPNFSGFGVQAIYSLKEVDSVTTTPVAPALPVTIDANDGYGVSATYGNGPISLAAGWNRKTNSNDSDYWALGGGYAFGPAKVTALYEDVEDNRTGTKLDQKNALIGLAYNIGVGTINTSFGIRKTDLAAGGDTSDKKFGLGYTHNLSKRTSLYANYARTDRDVVPVGVEDKINGVELGVTHNF